MQAVEWEKDGDPPAADIAAVLTVIKRRSADRRELEVLLDFQGAVLRQASLGGAHLEGAFFTVAHLEDAFLNGTHLERASLFLAHLEGAYLFRARLEGADLSLAEGLTQEQIEQAEGNAETKLPEGLTRPAHWTAPEGGAEPAA